MAFELPNLDNFEANLAANLEAFEKDGATLSRPVLAEGYYPANLKEITCNFGMSDKKTKGNPTGENRPWCMLRTSFELDSATARESLKQDNNPNVYTDNASDFLNGYFNLTDFGFTQEGNGQFWSFIGAILEQEGLATLKEEDGTKSYLLSGDIIKAIFNDKYSDEVKRLYGLAKAGEPITDDAKTNFPELIPAMLAKLLLGNITELLTGQAETRECVVLIGRGENNKTKEKMHYAKGYILRKDRDNFADEILA